jgi:hypothetical protein
MTFATFVTRFAALLPRIGTFGGAVLIGAVITSLLVSVLQTSGPVATTLDAPDVVLEAGDDSVDAFRVRDVGGGEPIATLPPADISLAAAAAPPAPADPDGHPRVPFVTQFDGSVHEGSNCTMASGAMFARLGWGIVATPGSIRSLADDQEGGTSLSDLAQALWRGYGVTFKWGGITTDQLHALLAARYGVIIQGLYVKLSGGLKLQKDFDGPHAIYLDGIAFPNGAEHPLVYAMDPIGRPNFYKGAYWPEAVVDSFGLALSGTDRIAAAWVYPPGGVAPDVTATGLPPLPDHGAGISQAPSGTPGPNGSAASAESEPGDVTVKMPVLEAGLLGSVTLGGLTLDPDWLICLLAPPPKCPDGIAATYAIATTIGPRPPPAAIDVGYVDLVAPNKVLIWFTMSPAGPVDVEFWKSDSAAGEVATATAIAAVDNGGVPTYIATLDVQPATAYQFQVVASGALSAGRSDVGTFTTPGL